MDLATTESCLRVGAWVPRTRPGRNLSRLYGDMATRFPERVRNSLKSMACPERRKELEVPIQRWRGVDCSDAQVSDAFDGQFGGVFSNASQPVAIAVLGDSVGQQLRVALQLAQLHAQPAPAARATCSSGADGPLTGAAAPAGAAVARAIATAAAMRRAAALAP